MKRVILATLLIAAMAIFSGCSKDKEKEDLRNQVVQLQEQVADLEKQNQALKNEADQAVLKLNDERRQADDIKRALDLRLLHQPLTEFTIAPAAPTENGWLMVDGDRTYTLAGHTSATKVVFYWADSSDNFKARLLAEDSNRSDGWKWTGALPAGHMRALWAEVHYPGGVKVMSAVLPLRSSGK